MKRTLAALLLLVAASALHAAPSTFSVKVTGKGQPMILIPGLASSADVWKSTVAHYQGRYQLHVLTLAGFGGSKVVAAEPFLGTVERELAAYIREQKLRKPVIIGHSLGGFLGFSLAAHEPSLVGRLIAIDGVPFLPALFNSAATPETAAAGITPLRDKVSAMTAEEWTAQSKQTLSMMARNSADVDEVVRVSSASDPKTVARAMYELMTTDLRPQLSKIQAPVLLIGAGGLLPESMQPAAKAAYESQVANAATKTVIVHPKSRHFVMYDEPAFLFATIDEFLAAAPAAVKPSDAKPSDAKPASKPGQ